MKRREDGLEKVIERRRVVEDRLAALRAALASETGRAPRGRGWLVAVVAAAVGLALATRHRSAAERIVPPVD
ncbi:MAG TPA: hypothetical protein VM617_06295 [Thermoanaerobaculia bacterium]|nr:hypothetical protein [Thermoanaerobaculia bacterium]